MNARWKLAKWFAGKPIIHDPTDGEDGAVIVVRSGTALMVLRASTLDLQMNAGIHPLKQFGDTAFYEPPEPRTGTFSGRIG